MNRIPSIIFMVSAIAVLFSCAPVVGGDPSATTTTTIAGTGTNVSSTLASIPEIKITLPKSLSAGSDGSAPKAMGEYTVLDPSTISGVKSQEWFNLQNQSGKGSFPYFMNKALKKLSAYASAHDIKSGQKFTMEITKTDLTDLFGIPEADAEGVSISATLMTVGDDEKDFYVYVKVGISMPDYMNPAETQTMTIPAKLHVKKPAENQMIVELFCDFTMDTGMTAETENMSIYAYLDSLTGECTLVTGFDGEYSVQRTTVDSSGAITSFAKSSGTTTYYMNEASQTVDYSHVYVAYGNDAAGGIATLSSFGDEEYYSSEYYNGTGDLIYRFYGDDELWMPEVSSDFMNLTSQTALGLSAAPEKIYIMEDYESGWPPAIYISLDKTNENSWKPCSGYGQTETGYVWGLYYKAGSTWQSGDGIYSWEDGEWDEENNRNIMTFSLGYTVPAPVTEFGKNFYGMKEYPLKNVLPLTAGYSSAYKLIRKQEGETQNYEWYDWEGNKQIDSWTQYSFYLNKTAEGNLENECETNEGDISLDEWLSQNDVYFWSDSSLTKTKSYFFRTTGNIPAYFTGPDMAPVNATNAGLKAAIDGAYALNLASFGDKLGTTKTDAKFDDL